MIQPTRNNLKIVKGERRQMKLYPMQMAYPYKNPPGLPKGDWRREGITSPTTYDAILAGERTATTRFPMWYKRNPGQLEAIKGIQPGSEVIFTAPGKPPLNVRVKESPLSKQQIALATLNDRIETLTPEQIMVFGSNTEGRHGKGAARYAADNFGAVRGQAEGLQGQSYGLITKDLQRGGMPDEFIRNQVTKLYDTARQMPDRQFLVTPVGTGLAGRKVEEIAPLFKSQPVPENVVLPGKFLYPELQGLGGATYALSKRKLEDKPKWLDRWSQLEGWSPEAGLQFFSKEPTQMGYQFQYELLN